MKIGEEAVDSIKQMFSVCDCPIYQSFPRLIGCRNLSLKFPFHLMRGRRAIGMPFWQLWPIISQMRVNLVRFQLAVDYRVLIYLVEEMLIDFHELVGEHSGENMAEAVWQTLETYGLLGRVRKVTFLCTTLKTIYPTLQVIAFVMDNATNNDTMVTLFEARCQERGIDFSASHSRLRCMPHTCHLAALKVDTGYHEVLGYLSKRISPSYLRGLG